MLGRVIEVVSGKTLGEFLNERIFTPLGMADTGFYVPGEKLSRAAQPWQVPEAPPMTVRFDVAQKPRFESGGGGLTGTMDDYLRFTTMLADGGKFAGKRLLGSGCHFSCWLCAQCDGVYGKRCIGFCSPVY